MPFLPLYQESWLLPDETECQSCVTIAWHRASLSRNHLVSISGFHDEDPGGTGLLSASGLRCLWHKTGPGLRTCTSFPGLLGPARSVECLPRSYNPPCKYGHPMQNKQKPVTITSSVFWSCTSVYFTLQDSLGLIKLQKYQLWIFWKGVVRLTVPGNMSPRYRTSPVWRQ